MKQILSIFLAVIYLATSSGLALQVHYCMDEVSGFSLAKEQEGSCGKCGMEKNSSTCCKDETKFVKLEDAHKLLGSQYLQHPPVAINTSAYFDFFASHSRVMPASAAYSHTPPGKTATPLHILYSVFRI